MFYSPVNPARFNATITDGDGTLSLNESTAFTYVGVTDDVGPWDMVHITISGGGTAIWMTGVGNSGGILVPLDQAAYNVFVSNNIFTIASHYLISSATYTDFYNPPPPNTAPVLGGTPADETVAEDVATAIDLSAYNVSDADGDTITLTLAVDRGSIASVDGNGTTAGVTIANSGTASMTLQGTAANLNTYLNDSSHLTFTTDSNDTTSATLTVTPNDGTVNGGADTVTINVTPQNDAPTATGVPSNVTVTEDLATDFDLSAVTLSDVDGDTLTVTLTASGGTFATPADGALCRWWGDGDARQCHHDHACGQRGRHRDLSRHRLQHPVHRGK